MAQKSKPMIDGELIKECIVIAFNEYCLGKVNLFNEMSPSHEIFGRRIDDLADSIVGTLQNQLYECVHYSLALKKSIDYGDSAQLAIFIRVIDINFNITEEMLDLCHMMGTTSGMDIFDHANLSLENLSVDRNKIISIKTDGAPALTGKNNGFITY